MPSAAWKHAVDIALELPPTERAALAHDLLASLDGPANADVGEALESEITQPIEDLQSGSAVRITSCGVGRRIPRRIQSRAGRAASRSCAG
jgi:Putative addiction module component